MADDPLQTAPGAATSSSPTRPRQHQQQQQQQQQQQPQSPSRDPAARRNPPSQAGKPPGDAHARRSLRKLAREGRRVTGAGGGVGGGAGVQKSRARLSPGSPPRSLLPAAERRSQEDQAHNLRTKKTTTTSTSPDDDAWEIAPDGGSGGRSGRNFTVANVGNNGRIYLRPTVRPPTQRYPQPQFVFPTTPPSTASLDLLGADKNNRGADKLQDSALRRNNQWTPVPTPTTPLEGGRDYLEPRRAPATTGHRRVVSDTTLPDTSIARESDPGGFKIVITQPGEDQRPKTLEDVDTARPLLLDVSIPSWKLGTPRFSLRGTPFIRSSSYAPTEEIRSTRASMLNRSPREAPPTDETVGSSPGLMPGLQVPGLQVPGLQVPPVTVTVSGSGSGPAPGPGVGTGTSTMLPHRFSRPSRTTFLFTHIAIEPAMFDALTFKPACDDRAIVRYSSNTGIVTAATPPRLVAEITSPTFLDYELLSDFFLTFRSFLEPSDLLRMLVARLRWALARTDEVGMVVRVRTFVAMRHWILNYFMDDFVIDYHLRLTFCSLLNDFVDELAQDTRGRKVQLKILAELKKCWRRVCAQYWDGPEFDVSLGSDVPIVPGGIAGHRNPNLDPSFWEREDDGPPQLDGSFIPDGPRDQGTFYADVSRAGHIDSVLVGNRPGTPEHAHQGEDAEGKQTSPRSINSFDVISCSFPAKNMRFAHPGAAHPLAAHPADPSSIYANASDPIATTPRALTGKRVRPQQSQQTHKRNGSLTDSLRDHAVTERVIIKNAEFLLTLPYAGSLVRGNLLPPTQPFVEVLPPGNHTDPSRHTTLFQTHPVTELPKEKMPASAMSGQGMRKLLGGVRRALSSRGQGVPPVQGHLLNISPIGPRGVTTNRLPGSAIVPQAPPPQSGVRPPVRIDLLGAEIAEDFKKAVREDAALEGGKQYGYISPPAGGSRVPGELLEYSAAHMETALNEARPDSGTGLTTGSKSIVIVDDTLPMEGIPAMAGALPVVSSSMEPFAQAFVPQATDPTPPNTPPGQALGTPRRSSYLFGRHVLRPSLSADPLPPLVTQLGFSGTAPSIGRSSDDNAIRIPNISSSRSRPPLSGVRAHRRLRSSRSYRSNMSFGDRRHASYTSGVAHPAMTIRSFDATTTCSDGSLEDTSGVPIPQPLRVLRRRPGGDLRAVHNVGELDTTLPRPRESRSIGSMTTFTDSIRSSFIHSPAQDSSGFVDIVDVVTSDYSPNHAETFSLGALAEQHPKRHISLFSTHSSKPVMRPSFEAEAQKLAQIPDDADDDGGVESALLKLEGKYEKRATKASAEMQQARLAAGEEAVAAETEPDTANSPTLDKVGEASATVPEKKEHRHVHLGEGEEPPSMPPPPLPPAAVAAITAGDSHLGMPAGVKRFADTLSFLSEETKASYSSTPLLERGLGEDGRSSRTGHTRAWTDRSILQGPEDDLASRDGQDSGDDSKHPSYEIVQKTKSMEKIQAGQTMPAAETSRPNTEHSFLNTDSDDDDDDDAGGDDDSDLSSELSTQVLDATHDGTSRLRKTTHELAGRLRQTSSNATPPSPPITVVQGTQASPHKTLGRDPKTWGEKPLPPTPRTISTVDGLPGKQGPSGQTDHLTGIKEAFRNNKTSRPDVPESTAAAQPETRPNNKFSVHLPFVLAFDSDVLAQQFTLIEKDALNEIDWKELVDMRWKNVENSGVDSRSWVSFLRDTDARGVEVVIARFNIMVKWAISEIILTQHVEERARCIIKYIHIAAHCRRYRNFATMCQLAIALTSNECSRLSKTWSLVPAGDLRTLQELEALISPTRNFYALRAEMEGGGAIGMGATATADTPCIPFLGIYTHDLLFNAQRPSEIASSPTSPPLVNFERCRIAAAVVKTLLRLLEASTLYDFQPIEGITERCLWMGALTDEEIRRYSQELE